MSQSYRPLLGTDLLADSRGYLNDAIEALRTLFSGATEPTSPVPYMLWADTTAGLLKMRNAANTAWITLGTLGATTLGLLSRAGGTMTGAIDMGGQQITNLAAGSGNAAARVAELDLKAPLAAPQFTGDARVNQDPAGNDSLIRRIWAESRYLKLSGGTMTGELLLSGNTSNPAGAMPRSQIAAFTAFDTGAGHDHDNVNSKRVIATNLDSGAAIVGHFLRADGLGGVTTGVAALRSIFDTPTLIVDRTTPIGWTTFDLSPHVPETLCDVAYLRLELSVSSGTAWTIEVRRTGSLGNVGFSTAGTYREPTLVAVSLRQFDYRVLAGSGPATYARIQLLGYGSSR